VNAVAPASFLTIRTLPADDEKTGELTPRGKSNHRPHADEALRQPRSVLGTVFWLPVPMSEFVTWRGAAVDGDSRVQRGEPQAEVCLSLAPHLRSQVSMPSFGIVSLRVTGLGLG